MQFASVRELKINSRSVLRQLPREDVVVTHRGKPVAAVIYMSEDLLDAYVISHHPTLLRGIEKDTALWCQGRLKTSSLEDVRTRLLSHERPARKSSR